MWESDSMAITASQEASGSRFSVQSATRTSIGGRHPAAYSAWARERVKPIIRASRSAVSWRAVAA
jgi:hypothetical protein